MSLMPKSRVGQRAWPPLKKIPVNPVEWEGLMKGSTKGFVVLLVSLSWWETQATKKKHKSMAAAALDDVLLVLRQLAAHDPGDDTSLLPKHARGAENSRQAPAKRCGYFDY